MCGYIQVKKSYWICAHYLGFDDLFFHYMLEWDSKIILKVISNLTPSLSSFMPSLLLYSKLAKLVTKPQN
jgi:hypothetical protein